MPSIEYMKAYMKEYVKDLKGRKCACDQPAKRFHWGWVCERCDELEKNMKHSKYESRPLQDHE